MMKHFLSIGFAAFSLAACSTPSSDVTTFFRPNLGAQPAAKTGVQPAFVLTAPGTVQSVAQNYVSNGYRLLGESDFANLSEAPLRAEALSYAQQIGASLVLYSVEPLSQVVQPVTKTILEQPARTITTETTTNADGTANSSSDASGSLPQGMNSEMREFEKANGINSGSDSSGDGTTRKTTTSTTYVPAKYRSVIVPQTFTRTQHQIAFLAK